MKGHDLGFGVLVRRQRCMAERFATTAPDSIANEVDWTDPVISAVPLSARRDGSYGIFEHARHEGDMLIRNYITSSRARRAAALEKAQ